MSTPEATNLSGLLRARLSVMPDELAYADAERRVSYAELDAAARRIAAGLQARGVGPGDHVALVLEAGVGFAETFWAVQHLGAVPCALNPSAPAEMLARRAQRVRAALVVDGALAAELERSDGVADEGSPQPDEPAFLQTTSGTSGEPRTAVVTHANVFAYHDATAKAQPIGEDDVLVTWVPHWHDLGLVNFVVRPVRHGAPCHIVRPAIATIPLWMETIGTVRGTIGGTPDFALRLAARLVDPARADLSSLRAITNGGEPVRATTVQAFERHFGISDVVYPGYGLAEATLGVTATPWGSPPLRVDERGNVACGPALGPVELRAGTSPEALGEILVRGPTVFAGYLDEPEATAEVLRDGWLHTGDLGYLDAEGLLYILGRERAIIKRGGAMFAPREFEEAAIGVPGVRLAVAVGVPARGFGSEEVVVAVEVKERSPGPVEAEVSAAVRRSLGFAPERVLVVPPRTIPSTLNGKVRHARMRELLLAGELG